MIQYAPVAYRGSPKFQLPNAAAKGFSNFSSFGLIQSELRNRLGNQKASKLVFMFKYMNQKIDAKKTNLEWAWEASASTEYHTDVADVINDSSDEDIPLALSMY